MVNSTAAFPFANPVRFSLSQFLAPDESFHLAQVAVPHANRLAYHTHDFPELFWVKSGKGLHYSNGCVTPLALGDLVFIRARDAHTLTALDDTTMVIVNIAFPTKSLTHYRKRYFPASTDYFWRRAAQPHHTTIPRAMINALGRMVEDADTQPRSPLALDRLLTFLFQHLEAAARTHDTPLTPDWLSAAMDAYCTPAHFQSGVAGFIALTHHCAAHVNRCLQRCHKMTSTAFVNQVRMQFAAHQLRITTRPVLAICHDCGADNVGHFYSLFKRLYAMSPVAYRLHHHRIAAHSLDSKKSL